MKFWVTDEEKERILKKAKGSQSLSDFLRKIALKGRVIHPVPAIDRTTFTELNRIGNNLNQIARHLNSAEANIFHKRTKKELQERLTYFDEKLDKITSKLNDRKAYEIKEISDDNSFPYALFSGSDSEK
ncbi:MAG: MobC family plasmid mobilization relaxosome protein [Prolixibacteraceae bacterium]|nr:MobC family plasmid mobilization relaxosome protein [Prolixibacteraceae bacterium]